MLGRSPNSIFFSEAALLFRSKSPLQLESDLKNHIYEENITKPYEKKHEKEKQRLLIHEAQLILKLNT